jgi:hypothetical protein
MSRAAPLGAVVRIFYDGRQVATGDALVTRTGRTYVVASVRIQHRGQYLGRQHLACLIAREPPAGAQIFPLYWYPRGRLIPRRGRRGR